MPDREPRDEALRLAVSLTHKAAMDVWKATLDASESAIKSAILINAAPRSPFSRSSATS